MKQLEGREAGLGEAAAAERNQLQVWRWERSPWVGFVRGSFMGVSWVTGIGGVWLGKKRKDKSVLNPKYECIFFSLVSTIIKIFHESIQSVI